MKILLQIAAVFGICWVGEGLAKLLPLPGSVISMILLLILLLTGLLKPHHIREKSDFLLQNMAFFFIPAGVGILENFDQLKANLLLEVFGILWENLLPFLAICILSTFLTFAVTAYTVKGAMWLQKRIASKAKKGGAPRA